MKFFLLLTLLCFGRAQASTELDLLAKAKEQGIQLTEDERMMLKSRAPTKETYVIGGIVGTYPGFGLGHAIQGRWTDTGWIYTVGEVTSLVVAGAGIVNCVNDGADDNDCNSSAITIGLTAYVGFKIAEIFDVWIGGARHRERYQKLKNRIEPEPEPKTSSWTPFLQKQGGGLAYAWRW